MDDLATFLKRKTGWSLSSSELIKIYSKYYDDKIPGVNYSRLLEDFRQGILIKEQSNFLDAGAIAKQKRHMNYDQVIDAIYSEMITRINCLSGENKLKKAYILIGESRSPVVTRQQLKIACQSRLSLFFNDLEIDEVFDKLDTNRSGTINIRQLINIILRKEDNGVSMSVLGLGEGAPRTYKVRKSTYEDNQNAVITYDKKFKGLTAPLPVHCRPYSIAEIERFIADRIFERSNLNDNMVKTTMKLFNDGESINGYHVITLDMMRYTLWKRLKMNVTDEDLQKFYRSYAQKSPDGVIRMFDFIEGIVKGRNKFEPILDDRTQIEKDDRTKLSAKLQANQHMDFFLTTLR